MPEFVEVCERAARAGGRILIDMAGRINVREKNPKDLVTEADLASQEAIRSIVLEAFPHHGFLGEEDMGGPGDRQVSEALDADYCWVVDPLDGTTNYVHQLPSYSVSIALMQRSTPITGVVYDPVMDECFSAIRGEGAWLNGVPIRTSGRVKMNESLIAASFPPDVQRDSIEVSRFIEVLCSCRALRRLGSAALNLCYVAAGRLDGYWATSVNTWDVAAGLLLVEEAGGTMSAIEGTLNWARPKFAAAASESLHADLLSLIRAASR